MSWVKLQCCGSTVTTNFCPNCGTKFLGGSLSGLLKYLRYNQEQATKHWTARVSDHPEMEHDTKSIDKWKNWADGLETLLERYNAEGQQTVSEAKEDFC